MPITFPDKNTGDTFFASEANQIKSAVNTNETNIALKVNISSIVASLASTNDSVPLAASQGKALQDQINSIIAAGKHIVADIAARDALTPTQTTLAYVLDASADATVNGGAALYIYDSSWIKVSEFESMDLTITGDGQSYHIVRTNATLGVLPTVGEVSTPISGDSAIVFLNDGTIEYYKHNGTLWILNKTQPEVTTIYKGDSALSGNRTVAMAGFSLILDGSGDTILRDSGINESVAWEETETSVSPVVDATTYNLDAGLYRRHKFVLTNSSTGVVQLGTVSNTGPELSVIVQNTDAVSRQYNLGANLGNTSNIDIAAGETHIRRFALVNNGANVYEEVWSNVVGISTMLASGVSSAGAEGLVPQPVAAEDIKVLYGDASWKLPSIVFAQGYLDFTTSEPSQVVGNIYVNTVTGNSSVSVQPVIAGLLYRWNGSTWIQYVPNNGMMVTLPNGNQYKYNGTTWSLAEATVIAEVLDSSGGAVAKVLPAATGSGSVVLYANGNVQSNAATLSVPSGESLNGVTDGNFFFSNYSNGTQFRATDVGTGEWVVAVEGSPQITNLALASWQYLLDDVGLTVKQSGDVPNTGSYAANYFTADLGSASSAIVIDNASIINTTDDTFVIPRTGNYIIHVEGTFDDTGATNSTNINMGLGISSTNTLLQGTLSLITTGDNASAAFHYAGAFNAGDDLQVRWWHPTGENYGIVAMTITVQELPSTEVVLAGMIEPTTLAHARFTLSADASGVVCPFDEGQGDTGVITNAAGTITLPPGKYRIESNSTRQGAVSDSELYNVTDGIVLERYTVEGISDVGHSNKVPYYLTVTQNTDIQIREGDGVTSIIWNGRESGVDAGFDNAMPPYACYIDIQQLPNSTVVMPDALPVEDVSTVLFAGSSLSGNHLITLDNGLTWNDVKNTYETLVIYYRAISTPRSGSMSVLTSEIVAGGSVHMYGNGSNFGNLTAISALTSGTGTWQTEQAEGPYNVTIVGVKAQKTVINTTDTPVNDQSASGYIDIGNMRIQWGTSNDGNVDTPFNVALHAPFANSSYNVVVSAKGVGLGYSASTGNYTTTQFDIDRNDAATLVTDWSWQAIGLKP